MSSKATDLMESLRQRWRIEHYPDGFPEGKLLDDLTKEFLNWTWACRETDPECAAFVRESVLEYHVELAEEALRSDPTNASAMVPQADGTMKQVWFKRKPRRKKGE